MKFDYENLVELIKEQMQSANYEVIEEEQDSVKVEKGKQLLLSLPKFTPSEAWGEPNHAARKQIEPIMKTMGGRGLSGKIEYIKKLQEPDNRIRSPRRIISTLILLESLSSCLNAFSASAAGFVFEGFLAALLGGRQVADPVGGNLPIQDIVAFELEEPVEGLPSKGVPMSLKLLSPKVDIKGSYTNLVDAMNNYDEMVYVVAVKRGGKEAIEIGSFKITKDNLVDIINYKDKNRKLLTPKAQTVNYDLKGYSAKDVAEDIAGRKTWEEKYQMFQDTVGYTKKIEEAKGGATQWGLTQNELFALSEVIEYQPLGTLEVSPDALLKTATMYIDVLGDTVTELFQAVQDLSTNINEYFISKKRDVAIMKGTEAIQNAQTIEQQTAERIEQEKEK